MGNMLMDVRIKNCLHFILHRGVVIYGKVCYL